MAKMNFTFLTFIALIVCEAAFASVRWKGNGLSSGISGENNAIGFVVGRGQDVTSGFLGLSFPNVLEPASLVQCEAGSGPDDACFSWGDYSHVQEYNNADDNECSRIELTSSYARRLDACFKIDSGVHWYGGGEVYSQRWPIEGEDRRESPFITGDHLNNGSFFAGGVLEKHWVLSNGVSIFIHNDSPLHYSLNTTTGLVCFVAQDDYPYTIQSPLRLHFTICANDNILEAHKTIRSRFFETPTSIPNERMLLRPFWSTWAQYHASVNQSLVLDYARRAISEGFTESSHIEIDDNWEPCYGQETFDPVKFPDPKAMIDEIKQMDLNVTVWVHPFVNFNCPLYDEGLRNGYFVKDTKGKAGFGSWWAGSTAGVIDVTNPEAVAWWHARLRKLQEDTGVDSFKFDAGETNWLPYHPTNTEGDRNLMPNLYTTKFVEACAEFGGLIETRTAHRNQDKGIFVRMMDKDSSWTYGNGLRSMIPTLFHFGLLGYPFVLPDMIGGNAYGGRPTKELYIRWMQVNVLMPSVQISIVPWDFDAETVRLTQEVLQIRKQFEQDILATARQATVDGSPLNRPLWWLDPTDKETYTIDHEYSLGNDIIVAPILDEGATQRDIYLPQGTWTSHDDPNSRVTGPVWLRDYPVPLSTVPIFKRVE